jgi:hypothetical protein
MTRLENKILRLVKAKHGISVESLAAEVKSNISSIRKVIKSLHFEGFVTNWKNRLYPNFRSIEIQGKLDDEFFEEIELPFHLTTKQIRKFIPCRGDDYWYCEGYLIDGKSKKLFEKKSNIVFDFDKFNYYLTFSMDNRNDISINNNEK